MVNISKSNQVIIEFGMGDMLIVPGRLICGDGLVFLSNQTVHPIGEFSDKFRGNQIVFDNPEIQAVMTFSNADSIDVFISELQKAKKFMKNFNTEGVTI